MVQPRILATRVSCAAHSRTCATEPGADVSWSEYIVWIESITSKSGAAGNVAKISRTDVALASPTGAWPSPSRCARSLT